MQAPEWVFFDLDNTLWDFDSNAEDALAELFHRHHLHIRSDYSVHDFIAFYKDINAGYWRLYEQGDVAKEVLRTARFTDTFLKMGIPASEHPEDLWHEYLSICPHMKRLMPGAAALLDQVSQYARIGIITNGFSETQHIKIGETGIGARIDFMVTSEDLGVAKPDAAIFGEALRQADCRAHEVVYIGDTYHTDVMGGIQAGLPVIWYNRHDAPEQVPENPLFLGVFQSHTQISAFMAGQWHWE